MAGRIPARSRRLIVSVEQFQRKASCARDIQISGLMKLLFIVRERPLFWAWLSFFLRRQTQQVHEQKPGSERVS
jgi:hypothetical protein